MDRKHTYAETLMRAHNQLRRAAGVPLSDGDGLWVLSRPTFPPERSRELVEALLLERPSRSELASAVGASEVLRVDGAQLARWHHAQRLLADRRAVERLVAEGIAPLRAHRRKGDFTARLDEYDHAVATLSQLLAASGPAVLPSAPENWQRLSLRVAWLFDQSVAATMNALLANARCQFDPVDDLLRAASRFRAVVRAHVRGIPPAEEDGAFVAKLATLPSQPNRRAKALFTMALEMLNPDVRARVGSASKLTEELALDRHADLEWVAFRVGEILRQKENVLREEFQAEVKPADLKALAAVSLQHRGTPLSLPPKTPVERLRLLCQVANSRSSEGLPELWNTLLTTERRHYPQQFAPELDAKLLARAVKDDVDALYDIPDNLALRRYLRALAALKAEGLTVCHSSIAKMFTKNPSATALMAEQLADSEEPNQIVKILGIFERTLDLEHGALSPVREWRQTHATETPEVVRLRALLDRTRDAVRRYLHLRRISGHGETFSAMVQAPLELDARELREEQALAGILSTAVGEKRDPIGLRLKSLRDPAARRERLAASVRRAQKAFDRSLEDLERESLERTLDAVATQLLADWLGFEPSSDAALHRRAALLAGLRDADRRLARELFTVLETPAAARDKLAAWPKNRAFLERVKEVGVDADLWVRGFSARLVVGKEILVFETERDPLQVLEMGSRFGTCLSLEGGCNGAAVLCNAIDVNKQVIYGRRADGSVAVRKLIGLTNDGRLVGYRTYVHGDIAAGRRVLSVALASWAVALRAPLSGCGKPASLHGAFWYDDGNEPWLTQDPDGDEALWVETLYQKGFEEPQMWEEGAAYGGDFARACRARHIAAGGELDGNTPINELLALRTFDWLERLDGKDSWWATTTVAARLPDEEETVRAFFKAARRIKTTKYHAACLPDLSRLSLLSFAEVCEHLEWWLRRSRAVHVDCIEEGRQKCLDTFAARGRALLRASWERGSDELALRRARRSKDRWFKTMVDTFRDHDDSASLSAPPSDVALVCGQSTTKWAEALTNADAQESRATLVLARSTLSPGAYRVLQARIPAALPEEPENPVHAELMDLSPCEKQGLRHVIGEKSSGLRLLMVGFSFTTKSTKSTKRRFATSSPSWPSS